MIQLQTAVPKQRAKKHKSYTEICIPESFSAYNIISSYDEVRIVGRLLGLMLFCIGIGMVIGMLISENVIIVISAGLCLLCGYHMFCR